MKTLTTPEIFFEIFKLYENTRTMFKIEYQIWLLLIV